MRRQSTKPLRIGFTLVELLVVLVVVGLLVSLLLPAVQSAREAARAISCKNNLKQISLALASFHDVQNRFPYGGWGRSWEGMPGRGSGEMQPGGWLYNLLPSIEQTALHELGRDGINAGQPDAYFKRMQTSLPLFVCPSRRSSGVWPVSKHYAINTLPHGAPMSVARSDYAINGGASHALTFPGPLSLSDGDNPQWWQSNGTAVTDVNDFTGICHFRTAVSLRQVEDGTTKTYLVGEKQVALKHYDTGHSPGDSTSMYAGYSFNTHRFVATQSPVTGNILYLPPIPDQDEGASQESIFSRFGSAHPAGMNFAMCDGSVQWVKYEIDPEVHRRLGHRLDGNTIDFASN